MKKKAKWTGCTEYTKHLSCTSNATFAVDRAETDAGCSGEFRKKIIEIISNLDENISDTRRKCGSRFQSFRHFRGKYRTNRCKKCKSSALHQRFFCWLFTQGLLTKGTSLTSHFLYLASHLVMVCSVPVNAALVDLFVSTRFTLFCHAQLFAEHKKDWLRPSSPAQLCWSSGRLLLLQKI